MRLIATLLLSCMVLCSYAKSANPAYIKLCEVNKCWTEQKDITYLNYPSSTNNTEHEWVRIHLQLVEKTLRARSTVHLTSEQKVNRLRVLDHLNEYWQGGNFPVNDIFSHRQPIFIDKYDNFCAVGYLVKATGYEHVSRMVAAQTNFAYVREMNYPELNSWAKNYGFTVDELAWIQPTYAPTRYAAAIGGGTDGEVVELYVDNSGSKMYVGGDFTNVDGTIVANNIAYVTESGGTYTWHKMGAGVDGKVNAIAEYKGRVFVAGAFSKAGGINVNNIAYWDGSKWNDAGCLWGEVKDLIVYNNELYACGSFDVCAALTDINFAKWDSVYNMWQQHPGLSGVVNSMHVVGGDLVLGGDFDYQSNSTNIIKYNTGGYVPFSNTISNEVRDIETFKGTTYIVCKEVATNTDLLQKIDGNSLKSLSAFTLTSTGTIALNTLCADVDTLTVGGAFRYLPMVGTSALNSIDITSLASLPSYNGNWFNTDSAINKMVVFKGVLIAGGKFKYGTSLQHPLNGIARKSSSDPISVIPVIKDVPSFNIYPNPAKSGTVTIKNSIHATQLTLIDVSGKKVRSIDLKNVQEQQISIEGVADGVYFAEISNGEGKQQVQRIVIQ